MSQEILNKQRHFFNTNKTKDISFRWHQLNALKRTIIENEERLLLALKKDLNKSEFEGYTTEIGIVLSEISFAMKHLKSWVRPKKVKTPLTHIGSNSYLYPEPYGVVLVLSPWNYPFQLAIAPLIGAIAAGNCAILKPSELTPHTSSVLVEMISTCFTEEYISVIEGGVETSSALLQEKFDYIFFTGSVAVGKVVMKAAAEHLTPVTLELGGKSPCVVHKDANLELSAKRIVWGKFLNAGQTCVAPDYLLVHQEIKDAFLQHLLAYTKEFYSETPLQNKSYPRIVSEKHFNRLSSLLHDGDIMIGGDCDSSTLQMEPTIITNIGWNDRIMQDEIFGPILPIITYEKLSDVLEKVRAHPKPLALYIFSEDQAIQQTVIHSLSFGGGCINDTVFHITSPYLPFGGVGESGVGAYHGKGSFDVFSHEKSILKQTTLFDLPLRYLHSKRALKTIKRFLK